MVYFGIHSKGEFSLSELMKSVKAKEDFHRAGAIATFVGVVRGATLSGEKVTRMELQAYEEQANDILEGICTELKNRPGIVDVQIHHFVGEFSIGEDLVYVMVAGGHRENVFGVLREAVERYKVETPVFKKEHVIDDKGAEKSYWVSEREAQENRRKK
jgi:molybdopterin synthase catalytic subunit